MTFWYNSIAWELATESKYAETQHGLIMVEPRTLSSAKLCKQEETILFCILHTYFSFVSFYLMEWKKDEDGFNETIYLKPSI